MKAADGIERTESEKVGSLSPVTRDPASGNTSLHCSGVVCVCVTVCVCVCVCCIFGVSMGCSSWHPPPLKVDFQVAF